MLIAPQNSSVAGALAANLSALQQEIAAAALAADRTEDCVTLVAVSKGCEASVVHSAAGLGLRALWRELPAGGAAEARAAACAGIDLALHRPDPGQQDPGHRRAFRLGARHRPVTHRRAPVGTTAALCAATAGLPAGQYRRRGRQGRRGGRRRPRRWPSRYRRCRGCACAA